MKRRNLVDYLYTRFCSVEPELDTAGVKKAAMKAVLPEIIANELTERQRRCLSMRFSDRMTQEEIAEQLELSQPTVSRHIKKAVGTVANRLHYCMSALDRAGADWLKYLE